ncbi:hypothetical protein BH11BAC3_BH11BAC3_32360 [soil metagenome]
MKKKPESTGLRFARSLAMGVILSMVLFYSAHVFGTWTVEEYFPRPETTSTILLHNKCAVLGSIHTLRPNTDISGLGEGINGTKLSGSFMNFSDGHVIGMMGLALLSGSMIFFIRNRKKRKLKLQQ